MEFNDLVSLPTVNSFTQPSLRLSLLAQYHIRQLLHANRDRLHLVAAPGRNLAATEQADLNEVLEGLYLEDPIIAKAIQDLEGYTQLHLRLTHEQMKTGRFIDDVEQRIFALLGLQREDASVVA